MYKLRWTCQYGEVGKVFTEQEYQNLPYLHRIFFKKIRTEEERKQVAKQDEPLYPEIHHVFWENRTTQTSNSSTPDSSQYDWGISGHVLDDNSSNSDTSSSSNSDFDAFGGGDFGGGGAGGDWE